MIGALSTRTSQRCAPKRRRRASSGRSHACRCGNAPELAYHLPYHLPYHCIPYHHLSLLSLPPLPPLPRYAHKLTTVYIVSGHSELEVLRGQRGWPFYEECLARLFKDQPRHSTYKVGNDAKSGSGQRNWPKVVNVDHPKNERSAGGRPIMDVKQMRHLLTGPPLAPSRFAAEVRAKKFTNGADAAVVVSLYAKCVREGFAVAATMNYPWADWDDHSMATLCEMIREVSVPRVSLLKLNQNMFTHIDELGNALAAGALPNLRVLLLVSCIELERLPPSLGSLTNLEVLNVRGCYLLDAMPPLPTSLRMLVTVDGIGSGLDSTEPSGPHMCRGSYCMLIACWIATIVCAELTLTAEDVQHLELMRQSGMRIKMHAAGLRLLLANKRLPPPPTRPASGRAAALRIPGLLANKRLPPPPEEPASGRAAAL